MFELLSSLSGTEAGILTVFILATGSIGYLSYKGKERGKKVRPVKKTYRRPEVHVSPETVPPKSWVPPAGHAETSLTKAQARSKEVLRESRGEIKKAPEQFVKEAVLDTESGDVTPVKEKAAVSLAEEVIETDKVIKKKVTKKKKAKKKKTKKKKVVKKKTTKKKTKKKTTKKKSKKGKK